MFTYNGNFPLLAFFLPDEDNQQVRTPFKYRSITEGGAFYSQSLSGLVDVGTNLTMITPKRLVFTKGSRVLVDGIIYSVNSINPFIPDNAAQGIFKRKLNAQYLIQLG